MKIVLSSAVLATVLAPAFSFSYLDSLGGSNPVSYSAPAGASPSNGASYLDALSGPSQNAPTGGGMKGYLDALPTNAGSSAGGGMKGYTDNLSGGAAPAPAAAAPAPAAPAAPAAVSDSAPVSSGGNYLDRLASENAISGPGITSYLDTVPRNAPTSGGAGIPTYKDALAATNTVTGTGAGMNTYTDNLSGGRKASGNYSPFGGSKPAFTPSFSGSAGGQEIGFTLEASDLSELVQSMSGGGTIRLSGSIDKIAFN
mmetsp:Transcript_6919/g.12822  ORF Transcript_6919/g.12822 Transcript_6919/m.12822 type:complete len:256 (-) Transcript_6919:334-1101(-)|eukprot:CAMPEP_0178740130 /NCGR_PEP_ID=MMETSP0744-20121128/4423_1 /TAXON_ID=913974 /ORGANISM="Nitzschia punctata, Strain CCMP561" /LENGTH=255 /DNA_ID=CAMNT_0020392877 /DNA_START=83 /DNA_END=850 /DNA_ORIENTATION=+